MREALGAYKNGNTIVCIMQDGTKIRWVPDGEDAHPEFPESIDLKITNRCDMNCFMCFPAKTKVLMADYTYRNIEDIKVGDKVIGYEEFAEKSGAKRKIEVATVLQTFIHVESELISIETQEGNSVTATPNHPFLVQSGYGANHARKFSPLSRIRIGDNLYAYGFPVDQVNYESTDYAIGYTVGAWVGDGCLFHSVDKNGFDVYNARFVTLDEEINDRVFEMTSRLSDEFYRLEFKMTNHEDKPRMSVRSNKRSSYEFLNNLIKQSIGICSSKEYACGYLAGFCDTEGHVDNQRGVIRLANTNMDYLNECQRCLAILGIDSVLESYKTPEGWENKKPVFNVRITGKYGASRFLWYSRPVCERKSLGNYLKTTTQYHTDPVIKAETINKKQYVYNLETTSHTYIANNLMVHNCHERSTPDGEHGCLNNPFLMTLPPYTELAIGGGNPLEHPDLLPFLVRMKVQNVLCNMTVHWRHFEKDFDIIEALMKDGLIHGLGVSVNQHIPIDVIARMINFPNLVVHTIAGLATPDVFRQLSFKCLNLLILGYKDFGRGADFHDADVDYEIKRLQLDIVDMLDRFKAVSFDNLAIEQLDLKQKLDGDTWKRFYMGNEGEFTMYVDLVNEKFATSSTSTQRFDILPDIRQMFRRVREVNGYERSEENQ